MSQNNLHFLLLCLPAQGQINPILELAKLLTRAGITVTLATTVHGLHHRMPSLPTRDGLSYASFSDGYDDGDYHANNPEQVMAEMRRVGSQTLTDLLKTLSNEGRPVSFIIYTLLLPWAASVARDMHVPSAFLSTQSATSFAIYHRYFNQLISKGNNNIDPSFSIKLPGLPLFAYNDIPTILLPSNPHAYVISNFQEHIQTLEQDPNPCVLVNTFDELEQDSIRAVDSVNMIAIGPLIPSDTSARIDLFERSEDSYIQWLDSKAECSVVYVSFGSLVVLGKRQMEEILQGMVKSQRPFLWVIRASEYEEVKEMFEEALSGEEGLIVRWCSQWEVLSHRAIGCFLTHCGWNSIVESLAAGVPMVGCPHFSDQTTNAKLVDEVWGTGVRVVVNDEGVVERGEIERCVDMVMGGGGERGEDMRRNAMKWKGLAMEALKESVGSSCKNLKQFLERLG